MEVEMSRFFAVVPFMNFGGSSKKVEAFNNFLSKLTQNIQRSSVIIVECALEGNPFVVTQASNPCHVQLKTKSAMQLKENLINIGASRLPTDWKYVAWIDPGIELTNSNWVKDTIEALRKRKIVQLFDRYVVSDGSGKIAYEQVGFVKRHIQRTLSKSSDSKSVVLSIACGESSATSNGGAKSFTEFALPKNFGEIEGQPGIAWATTHKTWSLLDGLLEAAIGGGGDIYMAYSLIGQLKRCGLAINSVKYKQKVNEWDSRASVIVQSNVGFVKGIAQKIKYEEEIEDLIVNGEKILNDNNFDPYKDLKRDLQRLQFYANPQSTLAVKLTEHITHPKAIQ